MSRPSSFTQSAADAICEQIACSNKGLQTICDEEGMPHVSTVFRWLAANESFRDQYARAREAQADFLADEIIAISDDGYRDYVKDDDGREVVDHDHIARARLRVDSRKWIASKLKPKKYGDRMALTGPDGEALVPPTFGVTFPQGFPGASAPASKDATDEPTAGAGASPSCS